MDGSWVQLLQEAAKVGGIGKVLGLIIFGIEYFMFH